MAKIDLNVSLCLSGQLSVVKQRANKEEGGEIDHAESAPLLVNIEELAVAEAIESDVEEGVRNTGFIF